MMLKAHKGQHPLPTFFKVNIIWAFCLEFEEETFLNDNFRAKNRHRSDTEV